MSKTRIDILRDMAVNETVEFRAYTATQYASIRGSAYNLAKRSSRRYSTRRVDDGTVAVTREA